MFQRLARPALLVPLVAVLLSPGCAQDGESRPAPSTVTVTAAPTTSAQPGTQTSEPTSPAPTQPGTSTQPSTSAAPQSPSPAPATTATEPEVVQPCSDESLDVTAGAVESADTLRRVVVSFTNTSSTVCALVGYPGADLVTAAGEVLVHVARRPANAAPHLELRPGETATADVQASAIDTASGESCGRIGTLTVTPPNNFQARLLEANLPICDATISSVG